MKKILVSIIAMVFVLALGAAYAGVGGGEKLGNGVTVSGGSYDTFNIMHAGKAHSAEGVSAGGLRTPGTKLQNGVTDFTGGSYDTFEIASARGAHSAEGVSAGGLRTADRKLQNGVTDFSGGSYDTFEIGHGAGR